MENIPLSELIYINCGGEGELKEFFRANGFKVVDTSHNSKYYSKDIDLIVTNPATNNTVNIEVKWDSRVADTANLYIEIINPRSKGGSGWYNFIEADFVYYGDSINRTFYIIKVDELKAYIESNKKDLTIKGTFDGSYGYIIPLSNAPIYNTIKI